MTYFSVETIDGVEALRPCPGASSVWGPGTLRGPAVTLALARALEHALPRGTDLQLARITFDLHSPVPSELLTSTVHVLRRGRRLLLVDAELMAQGSVRARARALFLTPGDQVQAGRNPIWAVERLPKPPPPGLAERTAEGRLYGSVGESWTSDRAHHESMAHKFIWFAANSLVENEALTPTQMVSSAADTSNVVSNWGAEGLDYINADVTVSLARLPVDGEVGVASSNRAEGQGLAVGSALLFDRKGVLGMSTITALPGGRQLMFR